MRRIFRKSFGGREDGDDEEQEEHDGEQRRVEREHQQMLEELELLEERKSRARNEDLRYKRHGFNAGISVFAWTAFWELANEHQDDWRFILLSWVCVAVSIWAAVNM